MKEVSLARGVRMLLDVNLNLKAGETVLVVTDTNKQAIAEAIAFAASERGAEVSVITMLPRQRHAEEPPAAVARALLAVDVALLPVSFSLTHTLAARTARDAGCRIISLPACTEDMFADGSLEVDFLRLQPLVQAVGRQLSSSRQARVLSGGGAVLTLPLAGRASVDATGVCREPRTLGVPPNVETAVSPLEGATSGILNVDGVVAPGGPVSKPITVRFVDGRIAEIAGGADAAKLQALLDGYDDPNVFVPVELGIGMNPKARMGRGSVAEDEGEFGSVHIGLGNGATFGSSISAKAHIDLVLKAPRVELDGKVLLDNKVLTVPGRTVRLDKRGEMKEE
jgi:leucyl aminopeptidase (aminopeptidase T)